MNAPTLEVAIPDGTSVSMAIQKAVLANPGITLREIAAALGIGPRAKLTSISARLTQLCELNKLRRDVIGSRHHPSRFWPTDITAVDLRELRRKPGDPVQRKIAGQRARRQAKAATVAASQKAHKPSPRSQVRIVDPPRPPKLPHNGTQPETVEQFLARGGQIQRLSFGQCNNDLRFDHSGTTTFEQRRPVVRAYPAAGVL